MKFALTNIKTTLFGKIAAVLVGLFVVAIPWAIAQDAQPPTAPIESAPTEVTDVADINSQITEKRRRLEELRQQASAYQAAVDSASGQVRNIQSQISTIDSQIAQTNFQIELKQAEIDTLELEMTALQQSIDEKNDAINEQKDNLANAIRQLDENSRTSTLALLVQNNSLADFYGQAQAVATISQSLQDTIGTLNRLKDDLQAKQNQLNTKRDDVQQAKLQLEVQKGSTVEQRDLKEELLAGVQNNQAQYDELLQQAIREEQQANATISALERQLQEQLNGGGEQPVFTSTGYIWPAEGKLTAYFRDPSYPFSCKVWKSASCLEHSGLDIGMPQGTPIRATADGIVSVVNDPGFYYSADGRKLRSALNFIGIIHGEGISSRYLHLSKIYVAADQFVKQGDVIGLSGGLPGTAGAGGITTGAHLHFEVRVNGIPDDPLKYLP